MQQRGNWLWPTLKVLLTVAILVAVGRQFHRDLQRVDLREQPPHAGWLALSGFLYVLGLSFSAAYWQRLLAGAGPRPSALAGARAYYVGHLGKYLPGKAWALLLRVALVRGHGVRVGVAAVTSTNEVLTTMAAGLLTSALLFLLLVPDSTAPLSPDLLRQLFTQEIAAWALVDRRVLVALALVLLAPLALALAPPVFNRLTERLARPFRKEDAAPLPRIGWAALLEGLALTTIGWLLLGVSLWAMLRAILPEPIVVSLDTLGLLTAYLATAYVAGFLLFVPGGLGVREFLLTLFLLPELLRLTGGDEAKARTSAALAVVLLRLVWTLAELLLAGILYVLPDGGGRERSQPQGKDAL